MSIHGQHVAGHLSDHLRRLWRSWSVMRCLCQSAAIAIPKHALAVSAVVLVMKYDVWGRLRLDVCDEVNLIMISGYAVS